MNMFPETLPAVSSRLLSNVEKRVSGTVCWFELLDRINLRITHSVDALRRNTIFHVVKFFFENPIPVVVTKANPRNGFQHLLFWRVFGSGDSMKFAFWGRIKLKVPGLKRHTVNYTAFTCNFPILQITAGTCEFSNQSQPKNCCSNHCAVAAFTSKKEVWPSSLLNNGFKNKLGLYRDTITLAVIKL